MSTDNTLRDETTFTILDRLHRTAKRDFFKYILPFPAIALGLLRGKELFESCKPEPLKNIIMPISKEQGELLYLTARSIQARNIVEYGSSHGVSTLYLAAAMRDAGEGFVTGSEIEEFKCRTANGHIEEAGLSDYARVLHGDAMEVLKDVPEPIDMVLLDGWKDLYLPVLELLKPRLRTGSVVFADDVLSFPKLLKPYLDYVRDRDNGFRSSTLNIRRGLEYSIYLPDEVRT